MSEVRPVIFLAFWSKSKCSLKMDNQSRTFDQKLKSVSKIEILVKNRNFSQKIEILVKNRNFDQKLKSVSKIEILVENRNFSQKSKFRSKI
mgnify:CR=1 FL=1